MGLGSDTGGSVRIPAALCGTVGLKTTVGRISRADIYPVSGTLDSVGPLTRSVEDAAHVYQAIQGQDSADETTIGVAPLDVRPGLKLGVEAFRIVFGETLFFEEVDSEVERAVRETEQVFSSLGASVRHIELPQVAQVMANENRALMIPAEACAVNRRLLDEHFDELDPVVARRMIVGRGLSAPDYYELLREWAHLRQSAGESLRDVDALIVPTTMIPARPVAAIDADLDSYVAFNGKHTRNTAVGNILNLCGVSVPCGFMSGGLPIGLMIYAKPFQEDVALRVAHAYEQATDWKSRHPDLSWIG